MGKRERVGMMPVLKIVHTINFINYKARHSVCSSVSFVSKWLRCSVNVNESQQTTICAVISLLTGYLYI